MYNKAIKPGILEVYCGPMKCGKSRMLIHRVDELDILRSKNPDYKKLFAFVKPSTDIRDTYIKSRALQKQFPCLRIASDKPEELLEIITERHKLIIIDEANFFDNRLVEVVQELLKQERNVVVGGLDLDFRGMPFGPMPYLLSIADEVHKLTAVCDYPDCERAATKTQRLINGKPAPFEAPIISVEGTNDAETYEARCLQHHFVPGKPEKFTPN
jgi:thymidine kinase